MVRELGRLMPVLKKCSIVRLWMILQVLNLRAVMPATFFNRRMETLSTKFLLVVIPILTQLGCTLFPVDLLFTFRWTYSVTRQKVARSWSTQLKLMELYPSFKFCASQAQQYDWLKTHYPTLYEKVLKKVKDGKFYPTGDIFHFVQKSDL